MEKVKQNIITKDGQVSRSVLPGGVGHRAGWMERGPKSTTGPSKIFVKGLCRLRSRAEKASFGSGGTARSAANLRCE